MNVGAALRGAREERKLSLDQRSHTTKIRVAILRAIEDNEIHTLPTGIYTRACLRAYAREVGLDVEDTVRRYLAQFEPRSHNVVEVAPTVTVDTWSGRTRTVPGDTDFDRAGRQLASMRLRFVGVALVIGLVSYVAFRGSRTPAQPSEVPAQRATSELLATSTIPPQPVEIATSGSDDANAPADRRQDALRLDIQTLGPCWVSATADGLSVVYQLMQTGAHQTIEARDEVVLRIGDPGAFTFLVNDIPGRTIGPAGRAVTLRITSQNYREFVSP